MFYSVTVYEPLISPGGYVFSQRVWADSQMEAEHIVRDLAEQKHPDNTGFVVWDYEGPAPGMNDTRQIQRLVPFESEDSVREFSWKEQAGGANTGTLERTRSKTKRNQRYNRTTVNDDADDDRDLYRSNWD